MLFVRSPSPVDSNYDFTLRHERVKLFAKIIKEFDKSIRRTAQSLREVVSAVSTAGANYYQVAQCINNVNPNNANKKNVSANGRACNNESNHECMSYNARVVQNYGSTLEGAARVFSDELMRVREGSPYVNYNDGVHKRIMANLHEVSAQADKAKAAGDEVMKRFKKFSIRKKIAKKKEMKYARHGVPISQSKKYTHQLADMNKAECMYQAKLAHFNDAYANLMQRQLYVTGHTLDDFLDLNLSYLTSLMVAVASLAPNGTDIVRNMFEYGRALGERIGASTDERVGSMCRRQDVPLARRSAHNFTNYFDIRTDDVVEVGTPRQLTARKDSPLLLSTPQPTAADPAMPLTRSVAAAGQPPAAVQPTPPVVPFGIDHTSASEGSEPEPRAPDGMPAHRPFGEDSVEPCGAAGSGDVDDFVAFATVTKRVHDTPQEGGTGAAVSHVEFCFPAASAARAEACDDLVGGGGSTYCQRFVSAPPEDLSGTPRP